MFVGVCFASGFCIVVDGKKEKQKNGEKRKEEKAVGRELIDGSV